jgi:anti-sigma factor RsiW
MKCEEVGKDLIGYLDRRANSAERRGVEEHLASCAACHARAEQLRGVWSVLEEVPAIEPSMGFDARVRAAVAAEPRPGWFRWLVPQPRLAFAMALLLVVSVWLVKLPMLPTNTAVHPMAAQNDTEKFQEINDLGVLENYEVVTKFDALSELTPTSADSSIQPQHDEESND